MNEQAIKWANKLGMLPINFLHSQSADVERYAMLNGYTNNFCLSFTPGIDSQSAKNSAWSANMSNFVSVEGDDLLLFNVNREEPERIMYNYALQNLPKFYEYLEQNQMDIQNGVVPFVMRHYRIIRNALREEGAAGIALKAFLYMLSRLDNDGDAGWQLPEGIDDIVVTIGNDLFEQVTKNFHDGLQNMGLVPDTKLLIRHSAGILFQEANYIARFSNQLELFPTESIRYEMSPKMLGSYFTPSYIARSIVEESLRYVNLEDRTEITIFDPACGSGVFLVETLHQLRTLDYEGHVYVIGWDIDPVAIDMANFVLHFEKREWGERMEYTNRITNSILVENQWPRADIILMNPPYNSWQNMTEEQREQANEIMNARIRPNMASLFYYRAAHSLNTNGVIGSLMPSSFLTADSHSPIRRDTYSIVRPRLICHLGNFVFTSAMADVSIIVASNNNVSNYVQMMWTRNVDEVTPIALKNLRRSNNSRDIHICENKDFSIYHEYLTEAMEKDSWMPLSYESLHQKRFLEQRLNMGGLVRAEELFDIKMGARTGANDVFIISNDAYKKIPSNEKKYFRPSVDSTSLRNGVIIPTNFVFFPYPEEENGFVDEDDLKERIPYVFSHFLEPNMQALTSRNLKDGKWWLLIRPRNWQFQPCPKLVSTEFGKAGNFGYDKNGYFVVERGMAWIPYQENVNSDFYYFYLAIFNSRYFNSLLQIYARQLAGGDFYNLERKYVRNIPLPVKNSIDESIVEILINYGKRISKEGSNEMEGLSQIVRKLYGE